MDNVYGRFASFFKNYELIESEFSALEVNENE